LFFFVRPDERASRAALFVGFLGVGCVRCARAPFAPRQSALSVLFGARVRPAVIAGLGVITLQQITGQPSVLYYASTIFEEAGVYVSATIAVACFKLVCTLISAYYVDRWVTRCSVALACAPFTSARVCPLYTHSRVPFFINARTYLLQFSSFLAMSTFLVFYFCSLSLSVCLPAPFPSLLFPFPSRSRPKSFGRRRLLYAGICLQASALAVMTAYFALNMDQSWLLICAMFLYVGGYQV